VRELDDKGWPFFNIKIITIINDLKKKVNFFNFLIWVLFTPPGDPAYESFVSMGHIPDS